MKLKMIWWYFFDKQRYRDYIILRWLKRAKEYYIKEANWEGMCYALVSTAPKQFSVRRYNEIRSFIPQYYPDYFDIQIIEDEFDEEGYWWPIEDRESRIKAFDKLIAEYQLLLK